MDKAKVVSTPLAMHFKLSTRHHPSVDGEKEDMKQVPYASVVGSLLYMMVCTRPDIAHDVCIFSHFLSNPGRALECCKVDYEISLWHFYSVFVFLDRETYSLWLYLFRHGW